MAKTDLPMLDQRRIEANILKPVYREMVEDTWERLGRWPFVPVLPH